MAQQALGPDQVRNVALVGHRSAGRTTLAERMLFLGGVVRAPGSVLEGTALLDHDPVSRKRGEGVLPGWAWLPWKGRMVFLTDTPGADAFSWPARVAALGCDLRVIVVSAPDGVEPGTERVLREARRDDVPTLLVVTRIDRVDVAGQEAVVEDIGRTAAAVLGRTPIALGCRTDGAEGFWTHGLADEAPRARREALGEEIALTDDVLLESWVEAGRLEDDAARDGLARAVGRRRTLPVLACSGRTGEGVAAVLDAITALSPPPSGDASAPLRIRRVGTSLGDEDQIISVFRVEQGTLRRGARLMSPRLGREVRVDRWYAIRGPRRARAQTLGPGAVCAAWQDLPVRSGEALVDSKNGDGAGASGLVAPPRMAWRHLVPRDARHAHRLHERIATLRALDSSLTLDEEENSLRLSGPSPDAVDRAIWRLRERWGIEFEAGPPPIAYLERPAASVEEAVGRVEMPVDGEMAVVGEVVLAIRPADPEVPADLVMAADSEAIAPRFHEGVEEGIRRALVRGPAAGYPVVGAHISCIDGAYDLFASEPQHLLEAASRAVGEGLQQSGTEILEPWSELEVHASTDHTGGVLSDLTARRCRIVGMEMDGEDTTILAECPDVALEEIAERLRATTRGLGWFRRRTGHYRAVPPSLVEGIVAISPYRAEAGVSPTNDAGSGSSSETIGGGGARVLS